MSAPGLLGRFCSDRRGVAAVEMALIAPILAGALLLSISVWETTLRRQQLDEALRVSSQYYLLGGSNDEKARRLGLDAWVDRPADADIAIDRLYRCGDTAVGVGTLCGETQTPPATLVKISATTAGSKSKMSRSEMVRVR